MLRSADDSASDYPHCSRVGALDANPIECDELRRSGPHKSEEAGIFGQGNNHLERQRGLLSRGDKPMSFATLSLWIQITGRTRSELHYFARKEKDDTCRYGVKVS